MSPIIIKLATDEDPKILQKLYFYYFCPLKGIENAIAKKRIFCAIENDKVIGLLHLGAKLNKVLMLGIHKEYRMKGIGKLLFNKAQETYSIYDISLMAVDSSIPFWEKLGFVKTGEILETKHKTLIGMRKAEGINSLNKLDI